MSGAWVNLDHPDQSEGWAHPTPASKCHYFREGKSLCGVHLLRPDQKVAGALDEGCPDDCRGCTRIARSQIPAPSGEAAEPTPEAGGA
jgi:hypothetical protein